MGTEMYPFSVMAIVREIQVDSDSFEVSYSIDSIFGQRLYTRLMSEYPTVDVSNLDIELISYHSSDGIDYKSGAYCLTCVEDSTILSERYGYDCLDYYVMKIDNGGISYKIHQKYPDTFDVDIPFEVAKEFGIGIYKDYRYYYFYHTNTKEVYDYYGFAEPKFSQKWSNVYKALFGITTKNGKVLKLKRYFYPRDIGIYYQDNIFGVNSCI